MNFGPRQMVSVDMSCASCGNHISELPFQPTSGRPVYCNECNRARRNDRPDRSAGPRAPRQMFSVNLNCGDCGTAITELPFQPSGDKPVYCRACLQNRRG